MKTPQELASADEVIRDYPLPNSWVDQGNLFFAATEYRNAYKELQEKLSVATSALKYIIEHELHHGLNQGKPSEQVAVEALEIMGEKK